MAGTLTAAVSTAKASGPLYSSEGSLVAAVTSEYAAAVGMEGLGSLGGLIRQQFGSSGPLAASGAYAATVAQKYSPAGLLTGGGTLSALVEGIVETPATTATVRSFAVANSNKVSSMPAHEVGDVILAWAFRATSSTPPTKPNAPWVSLASRSQSTSSVNLCALTAISSATPNPTFTNATQLAIVVLKDAASAGSPVLTGGFTSTIIYPAMTMVYLDGSSRVLRFAGHANTNHMLDNTPAGYAHVTGLLNGSRILENTGTITADPVADTQAVTTQGNWISATVEIPFAP
jgi:hypothetical protein